MATHPLCPASQQQLDKQSDTPHEQLVQFAHYEASTVDGGFTDHEYQCNQCGHKLRHLHGITLDEGWTEIR